MFNLTVKRLFLLGVGYALASLVIRKIMARVRFEVEYNSPSEEDEDWDTGPMDPEKVIEAIESMLGSLKDEQKEAIRAKFSGLKGETETKTETDGEVSDLTVGAVPV